MPAACAACTPFGESSSAIASPAAIPSLEVQRRSRLGARAVPARGDDGIPAVEPLEPVQLAIDPAAGGAGDDRFLQSEPLGVPEILGNSGPELFRLDEHELVLLLPRPEQV